MQGVMAETRTEMTKIPGETDDITFQKSEMPPKRFSHVS